MGKRKPKTTVGFCVTEHTVEAAVFTADDFKVESAVYPLPTGVIADGGDEILDVQALSNAFQAAFKNLNSKNKTIHLTVPATLLRMVDMPRLEREELFVSLSSEAERYKAFDGTEAVVDFETLPQTQISGPTEKVLFGAIRRDTLDRYHKALSMAKLKALTVDLAPMSILRSVAGQGVLDSLIQQIGPEAHWGCIFTESDRVRFSLWQNNQLLEFREVNLNTRSFLTDAPSGVIIEDIQEEIRRTTKTVAPVIWLTQGVPDEVNQTLEQNLGVPVRPLRNSPNLKIDNPALSLTTIGSTMREIIDFPFVFDLKGDGKPRSGGKSAAADEGGDSALPMVLGVGCVLSAIIVGTILLGMWGYHDFMLKGQVEETQEKLTKTTSQLALRKAELERVKNSSSVAERIHQIADEAKMKNNILSRLSYDLRNKVPADLWLYSIYLGDPKLWTKDSRKASELEVPKGLDMSDKVVFRGISIEHDDVVDFARSFDKSGYIHQVDISLIEEELIRARPYYSFMLFGAYDIAAIAQQMADDAAIEEEPTETEKPATAPPVVKPD